MDKSAKIVYETYTKNWIESNIFKGPPAIGKGLAEFLKECANQIYWKEAHAYPTSNEWMKFRDLLEDLADDVEKYGKENG